MARAWLFALAFAIAPATAQADEGWIKHMTEVHAKFTGKRGTLALFGDSITLTRAFWAPLAYAPRDLPEPIRKDLQVVKGYIVDDCWSRWRGPEYGNETGKTTRWAEENVEAWLKKLNPETAIVMFGTNDLDRTDVRDHAMRLRSVVERCLRNGTIVILTTIPPRDRGEKQASDFAEAERQLAADLHLPLIDYQAEILRRRPEDWNGKLPQFKNDVARDVYAAPTLICGDGVHPSNPSRYSDYSEDALNKNGYQLRTVMTLRAYAEVVRQVLAPSKR